MASQGGKHFDPDLLQVFLDGFDEFCEIARRHPDNPEPAEAVASPETAPAAIAAAAT